MNEKKNEIIHCHVDLTPIEKDGEGQLRGGFIGISTNSETLPYKAKGTNNCIICINLNFCPGGATTTPAPTSTSKSSKIMMDFFSGGLF